MARGVNDKHIEALGLLNLGQIIGYSGDVGEGIPMVEASLPLLRELDDKWGQAIAIGSFALDDNGPERSKALTEALALHRELGNLSGIAGCLNALALRNLWAGEFSSAAQELDEAFEIYRQTGSRSGQAEILGYYGNLASSQGRYQQACDYYDESIALSEKINFKMSSLWARANKAYAILHQGDVQRARIEFESILQRMQQAGLVIGMIYAIEGFASLHLLIGQPTRAARLFAWGDAMREKNGGRRPVSEQASVEKDLAVIHSKIDNAEFTRLSAEGRTMTVEQAIALALEA
jgi:tetratricopeptide (TPR) repeat protein